MDQLAKIIKVMGPPSIQDWPGLEDLPLFRDKHGSCELPFRKPVDTRETEAGSSTRHGQRKRGESVIPPEYGVGSIPDINRKTYII